MGLDMYLHCSTGFFAIQKYWRIQKFPRVICFSVFYAELLVAPSSYFVFADYCTCWRRTLGKVIDCSQFLVPCWGPVTLLHSEHTPNPTRELTLIGLFFKLNVRQFNLILEFNAI